MKLFRRLLLTLVFTGPMALHADINLQQATDADSKLPLNEQLEKRHQQLTDVEQDLARILATLLNSQQPQEGLRTLSQDLTGLANRLPAVSSCALLTGSVNDQLKNMKNNPRVKADTRAKVESLLGKQLADAKAIEDHAKTLSSRLSNLEKECDGWIAGYNELNKIDHAAALDDLREHLRVYKTKHPLPQHRQSRDKAFNNTDKAGRSAKIPAIARTLAGCLEPLRDPTLDNAIQTVSDLTRLAATQQGQEQELSQQIALLVRNLNAVAARSFATVPALTGSPAST